MMMTEEQVVLVNPDDSSAGLMGKTEAHEKGLLHRAISILIFNSQGEMLLQQRAMSKYHWAGIWSNACCTHPRENETYQQAAERRLVEELGFETPLNEQFHFIYKAKDEQSGLTEHELDHVFTGTFDGDFEFNPEEVQAVRWAAPKVLLEEVAAEPEKFSFWIKIILDEFVQRELL